MYVSEGRFVARPRRIASVVDLQGGHVVPPFAEAHNHNLEWEDEEEEDARP